LQNDKRIFAASIDNVICHDWEGGTLWRGWPGGAAIRHISTIGTATAGIIVALSQTALAQYAPSIPARPGADRSYQEFQQDDYTCQQWANVQVSTSNSVGAVAGAVGGAIGGVVGAVTGTASPPPPPLDGQVRFDSLYQQCMVGRGDVIGPPPRPRHHHHPPPPPPEDDNDGPSDQ
jgi:hypothetical protein